MAKPAPLPSALEITPCHAGGTRDESKSSQLYVQSTLSIISSVTVNQGLKHDETVYGCKSGAALGANEIQTKSFSTDNTIMYSAPSLKTRLITPPKEAPFFVHTKLSHRIFHMCTYEKGGGSKPDIFFSLHRSIDLAELTTPMIRFIDFLRSEPNIKLKNTSIG